MKKTSLIFSSLLLLIIFLPSVAQAYNDFSVEAITVSPSSPAKNEPSIITVRVNSNGDTDLTDLTGLSSSDVTPNFKDFSITKTTLPTLPIKHEATMYYRYEGSFSSVGRKSLYFQVNKNNTIAESSTGNNYNQVYIEVVEPYDYRADSITVYPKNPGINEDAMIEIKATNKGFISFTTNQSVGGVSYTFPNFKIDSTVWPTVDYDENRIETDDVYYYKYYGKFTSAGEIELSYTLDSNEAIDEKDETNNKVSKKMEIFPLETRNLKISKIDFDIEKPIVDEEIEITLTVVNDGKVSLIDERGLSTNGYFAAIPPIEKGFFYDLDDFILSEFTKNDYPTLENPLDPGEAYEYTFLGNFHNEGEKTIDFTVDLKQQLAESTYTDNASSTKIKIYKDAEARDKFQITSHNVTYKDSKTAVFSWTTDQESRGAVWYKQSGFTSFIGETWSKSDVKTHSVTITDLKPGYLYEYKIVAENNTETDEITKVFFTMPTTDTVEISEEPVLVVNGNNINVSWETNLISYSHLYYRLVGVDSYKNSSINTLTDKHSINVSSLADGEYEYYVKSESQNKSAVDSAVKKFTIKTTTTVIPETTTQEEIKSEQTQTTTQTQTQNTEAIAITNQSLYTSLKGKIILTVEANGEAYYINPKTQTMNYLGRPDDAFSVMRSEGVGITTANLEQIQIGLTETSGPDTDGDGLSDLLEDAIGTDKNNKDTDGDGFDDKTEVANGANPNKGNNSKYPISSTFAKAQSGKIFLQVEGNGEAWYINPADNKRYFLGRPADAFAVMRNLGLGISNSNFESLN